ncbi:MAG: transposase [Rhodobacteraceae bacterium]|nr:transposase [Paracoccaceae bacterium]
MRAFRCRPGRPRKRRTCRAKYRKMHQTPWLLATPLPHHLGAGTRIKRIYAQRMQIEETIRDLKSHQFGFAQRYARTKRPEHFVVLLLVAALASFILWVLGLAAADRQWARHFQVNTERRRPFRRRCISIRISEVCSMYRAQ